MSQSPVKNQKQADQYQIVGNLGKGAYGKVLLAKRNDKLYAMKKIQKIKLAKQKKEYQAFVEKQLLRKIQHPGIIKLAKCFQDGKYLYYILQYCHGGDFTNFIKLYNEQLTSDVKKFYVAEIVSVLEYLHNSGITHRDLKPENIMLSKDGHLKLIDFGTAQISRCTMVDQAFKQNIAKLKKQSRPDLVHDLAHDQQQQMSPRKRKSTFVGTCYYLSPELLEHNICEAPSDLWALGCILYQLYYLQPPFTGTNEYLVFEKIKNVDINYPKNQFISDQAIDLIKRLIKKDPNERLGSNSGEGLKFDDLKKHPYFAGITFQNIFAQSVPQVAETQKKQEHKHRIEKIRQQIISQHQQKLKKQEIIMHGIVQKKSFALFTISYLIVQKQSEIYEVLPYAPYDCRPIKIQAISQGKAAEIVDNEKFRIVADETKLTIRSDKANQWVQAINKSFNNS